MVKKIFMVLLALVSLSACQTTKQQDNSDTIVHKEKAPPVVTADIEAGIRNHVDEQVRKGNGYFHMNSDDQELKLKLVRVHTEYLANLGPRRHFACVDLADVSGDVYDVDFFLEGDPGNMSVTETTLHKLNGKPFYSWKQAGDDTWHRVPVEESSAELLGVIEGVDHFDFSYKITLPEMDEDGKMWVPLAESDRFQNIKDMSIKSPVPHRVLEEAEHKNKVLYLELTPRQSGEFVEITYQVTRKEKQPYEEDSDVEDYLSPDALLPVNERFSTLADSIIGEKRHDGTLVQARALYDYLIDNMKYIKNEKYGTGDAVYACDAKLGNCSEFHSFFISLARSVGIPARFAIGAAIPSSRDEGGISGYHCWAEFHAEGKWWPIDVSEANKFSALATYYFGRHPANRIEFSRGRDLVLSPGPRSGPINFFAYPVLEVGGQSVPAKTTFTFNRKEKS